MSARVPCEEQTFVIQSGQINEKKTERELFEKKNVHNLLGYLHVVAQEMMHAGMLWRQNGLQS